MTAGQEIEPQVMGGQETESQMTGRVTGQKETGLTGLGAEQQATELTGLEAELQTGGQETELQVTELRMGIVLQPETINREHEMETDLLIY